MSEHVRLKIQNRSRCPHCWKYFAPEDSLWIAAHQDLVGDPRLDENAALRFLPSRFDIDGKAIDSRGLSCSEIACPNCHLQIPRPVLEVRPVFLSIAGTPSCGKSYFLASMTWQLRRSLPTHFQLGFADADGICNQILSDYEEQQFFNPQQDKPVKLAKTEQYGDWYSEVTYENQIVTYPKPFLFTVQPHDIQHPAGRREARLICLYDNAGESFQAGKDTVVNAVTRHLSIADAWLFCFDPTQDPRFRMDCKDISQDVQVTKGIVTARQEPVFHEMVSRIRKHSQLTESDKTDRPLIILCNKYDAWWKLLGKERLPNPWKTPKNGPARFDLAFVRKVSDATRKIINKYSPELVSNAESFSTNCFFIPVSATGVSPEFDSDNNPIGIRPKDMNPMWCDVPLLTVLAEQTPKLVPHVKRHASSATGKPPKAPKSSSASAS